MPSGPLGVASGLVSSFGGVGQFVNTGSSFLRAMSAAQPYLFVAQMAFGLISSNKQKSEAKRADNRATAVVEKDVAVGEADENIHILGGYKAGTKGHRTFIGTSSNVRVPARVIGRVPADANRWRSAERVAFGKNNEYLMASYVVSAGEAGRLQSFKLDDRDPNVSFLDGGLRTSSGGMGAAWTQAFEQADDDVTTFTQRTLARPGGKTPWRMSGTLNRDSTATYDGLTVVNIIGQLPENTSDVKYRVLTRIPTPWFIQPGIKLRRLEKTANVIGMKAAAHDELLSAFFMNYAGNYEYGPGLGVDDDGNFSLSEFGKWVNLDLLFAYQRSCLYITHDPAAFFSGNTLNTQEDLTNQIDDITTFLEQQNSLFGVTTIPYLTFGGGAGQGAEEMPDDKPKHIGAYAGHLDTGLTFLDAFDQIFQSLPYTARWWDKDGKIAMKAPNWAESPSSQSVFTLTDAHLVEPVNKQLPDVDSRLNQHASVLNDESKDFHKNTWLWPESGSADDAAMLAEDGGERLRGEERLTGVANPDIAKTISRTKVLTSRRPIYAVHQSFAASKRLFEPGDVITVNSPDSKVEGKHMRVEDLRTDWFAGTQRLTCREFVNTDYQPTFVDIDRLVPSLAEQLSTAEGIGSRLVIHGKPRRGFMVKANTPVTLRATVEDYDGTGVFTWSGENAALSSSFGEEITATPTRTTTIKCSFRPTDERFAEQMLEAEVELLVGNANSVEADIVSLGDDRYVPYLNGPGTLSAKWRLINLSGAGNEGDVLVNTPLEVTLNAGRGAGTLNMTAWTGSNRLAAIRAEAQHAYASIVFPFSLRLWATGGAGRNTSIGRPCVFLETNND